MGHPTKRSVGCSPARWTDDLKNITVVAADGCGLLKIGMVGAHWGRLKYSSERQSVFDNDPLRHLAQ